MTLIEVVICILIIGITVVGLISGLFTTVRFSAENEDLQRISAVLVTMETAVKDMDYLRCGGPVTPSPTIYTLEVGPPPNGFERRIIAVETWHPTEPPAERWKALPNCPVVGDAGVQRLTVSASYRSQTDQAQIVKREDG